MGAVSIPHPEGPQNRVAYTVVPCWPQASVPGQRPQASLEWTSYLHPAFTSFTAETPQHIGGAIVGQSGCHTNSHWSPGLRVSALSLLQASPGTRQDFGGVSVSKFGCVDARQITGLSRDGGLQSEGVPREPPGLTYLVSRAGDSQCISFATRPGENFSGLKLSALWRKDY